MFEELKKIFHKQNEEVTPSTISYLAHRYKRFMSGSGCAVCWHTCRCKSKNKLPMPGPSLVTASEKIAYEYEQSL